MKNLLTSCCLLLLVTALAQGHCQIPCGIYGDDTRFSLLMEHVKTIRISVQKLKALSQKKEPDHNQIARWVSNKDAHADKIIDTAAHSFLAQRIKKSQGQYAEKLELLHGIIVSAMKTKQSLDEDAVDRLGKLLLRFKKTYLASAY